MNLRPPSWKLTSERCPYCADEGELIFSRCPTPSCATIVLIYAECGTVYSISDKTRGKDVGELAGATSCHRCKGAYHHDFPPASSDEIKELGFAAHEYRDATVQA